MIALGVLHGLAYGLLAVGLVLAFRARRVLNLAHGQIGALAAVVMAVAVQRWGAPYWIALPAALALGAGIGALVELGVVRRLRQVPPLLTLVATLGVAQVLLFGGLAIAAELPVGHLFPEPPGLPSFRVGALLVTPALFGLATLGPVAVLALAWLLHRTRFGLAVRASAANPEAARLAGIPAETCATLTWALAGALSALTAVLLLPGGGSVGAEALGPALLLRALAAAVLARLSSLTGALAAGVAIGVVDEVLQWETRSGAAADAAILGVLALGLLTRRPMPLRSAEPSAWNAFARWPKLPPAAREVPLVRWSGAALGVVLAAAALAAPLLVDGAADVRIATVACFALVGLSVFVVTGLAGELSLGQYAIAGVGAAATVAAAEAGAHPLAALGAAVLAGALAAAALALPVLRSGGLGLTVVTLGFALAAPAALFDPLWSLDSRVEPLSAGALTTDTSTGAALLAVMALLGAFVGVRAVADGAAGRALVAARDNPAAARALAVWPGGARLAALAAGGALAGLAGALMAHVLTNVSPAAFPPRASVDVVAIAVVGGLALASGPLLGALLVVALPVFVPLSSAALAASAFGWLVLLLYSPGGIAALLEPVRRRVAGLLLRVAGHDPALALAPAAFGGGEEVLDRWSGPTAAGRARPPATLAAERLAKSFGELRAVDGVSLAVAPGEIVALVGPNGAGKTTVADVVAGLLAPDSGRVLLDGEDVTALPAELRARRGLGRTFQDGWLFPTLTVAEVVRLAAERRHGVRPGERRAREVVEAMGLAHYADAPIRTLSTGTRRVVELAALLAAEPRALVLDEPCAGLARPEADALGRLLGRLRADLGLGMLLIEHDLAVVEATADRAVVLREGRVVSAGAPADVLAAPLPPAGRLS